jgi:endonuclease/exonuclease/phosphatase (EEP) superfamily protein YafD
VVVLTLFALLRWLHEASWWMVAVTAISPWLYFSAWVVAGYALATKRLLLGGVAGLLVALSIWWLVPQWWPVDRAPHPVAGSARIRIFDANIKFDNRDLAGIGAEITKAQPSVITLEELTPTNLTSLEASGALSSYQWKFLAPNVASDGFGVWSKIPLSDVQRWFAGPHLELRGWLQPATGPRVRLYVVHTGAPRKGAAPLWKLEMSSIEASLRTQKAPLIVAGDFNATWDMFEFQSILHVGLTDTAAEQGKGWEMTWSREVRVIPPFMRIDHVLYSRGITSTGYHSGIGSGSDHRPIIADLAIAP